ncbi:MAG: DNA-binding response regulator, partial [Thermoflexia bacterium]
MHPLRLLLVDDHILFRKGLARLLDAQPDFQVVGEASDGAEGIEKARALRPDVVLMDLRMPVCDGLE